MKKIILIGLFLFTGSLLFAQNTFPTSGNVGVGMEATQKLSVAGIILSSVGSNEGGALWLENPSKTANNLAYRWSIYNMTGAYGNSLQFWSYNHDTSMMGPKFAISDNGNVGIGSTSPMAKLDVAGNMLLQSALNNSSPRPSLSTQPLSGEIRSYSQSGYAYNDGLLRLSAGAGTTPAIMSYIDISSYSTIPDMDQNIVFGTAGQEKMRIHKNGNIGIGTANPTDMLTVAGKIGAREIKVSTNAGADFVFEPGYKLADLSEVECFVKANKHLPEIPAAKEMIENGVSLGELNIKLLQKVEELTLYLIEQDKKIDALIKRVDLLETNKSKKHNLKR
ncbi:hypothetical protein ACFE6N_23095 [Pedobacter sp. BG31]|uniref:hypothetical protein n=1 Tax=Pedobacter sp. BG31 TaxID=3349697 RepID=UPI0035F3B9C5